MDDRLLPRKEYMIMTLDAYYSADTIKKFSALIEKARMLDSGKVQNLKLFKPSKATSGKSRMLIRIINVYWRIIKENGAYHELYDCSDFDKDIDEDNIYSDDSFRSDVAELMVNARKSGVFQNLGASNPSLIPFVAAFLTPYPKGAINNSCKLNNTNLTNIDVDITNKDKLK